MQLLQPPDRWRQDERQGNRERQRDENLAGKVKHGDGTNNDGGGTNAGGSRGACHLVLLAVSWPFEASNQGGWDVVREAMYWRFSIAAWILPALLLSAADQAWKNKQFPEWTEEDAEELLKDSPWVKTVVTTEVKAPERVTMDRRGRRGGVVETVAPASAKPPTLTLRWESALPVREAELKARDVTAPTLDNQDYYAIAVYGIPRGMLRDDSKIMAEDLRRQAVLKREGKKDTKPTSVEILLRDDGPVVRYRFPKSAAFDWRDHKIEFDAQMPGLKFTQAFSFDEMTFHGKLEL